MSREKGTPIMNKAIPALASLALVVAVSASHARCPRACRTTISTGHRDCNVMCAEGTPGEPCRAVCRANYRDDKTICRTTMSPTPPGCGQAFTKVTTGDIVTNQAWFWN